MHQPLNESSGSTPARSMPRPIAGSPISSLSLPLVYVSSALCPTSAGPPRSSREVTESILPPCLDDDPRRSRQPRAPRCRRLAFRNPRGPTFSHGVIAMNHYTYPVLEAAPPTAPAISLTAPLLDE
jgi:hypothetical protein